MEVLRTTSVHANGGRILIYSSHQGVQAMHIILIKTYRAWRFPRHCSRVCGIVSQDYLTHGTVATTVIANTPISSTITEMCICHVHCNNKLKSTSMSCTPLMSSCYHCVVNNIKLSSTCTYMMDGYRLLCLLPS